ncbi:Retrovirus-related Pol polyprotein from transposon TNT 1-94, partial [Trichinella pseudospiralis]
LVDSQINSVIGGACNCPNLWEDYDETFTSVVRYETIHMLFNVAAVKSLNVPHFDIKCAHLNAEYQEKLHTEHPHCFEDPSNKNIVWAKFSMPRMLLFDELLFYCTFVPLFYWIYFSNC